MGVANGVLLPRPHKMVKNTVGFKIFVKRVESIDSSYATNVRSEEYSLAVLKIIARLSFSDPISCYADMYMLMIYH